MLNKGGYGSVFNKVPGSHQDQQHRAVDWGLDYLLPEQSYSSIEARQASRVARGKEQRSGLYCHSRMKCGTNNQERSDDLPYLHRTIAIGGGDVFAIGQPDQSMNRRGVGVTGKRAFLRCMTRRGRMPINIPDLHKGICT